MSWPWPRACRRPSGISSPAGWPRSPPAEPWVQSGHGCRRHRDRADRRPSGRDRRSGVRRPDRAGRPRRAGPGASRGPARRVHVTLIDRNSYSTFQPLLYQVATAGLTSADVAYPAWTAVHKAGAHFRKGEIIGIDPGARQVQLANEAPLGYDYLILATGVSAAFFGVSGAAEHSLQPVHQAGRDRPARSPDGRARTAQRSRRHQRTSDHGRRRRRHRGRAGRDAGRAAEHRAAGGVP